MGERNKKSGLKSKWGKNTALGGMRNEEYTLNKTDFYIIFEAIKRRIERKEREETEMRKAPMAERRKRCQGRRDRLRKTHKRKRTIHLQKKKEKRKERKRTRVRSGKPRRERNDERGEREGVKEGKWSERK